MTAVRSEDEQPSPFLDVVDPPPLRRAPFTDVAAAADPARAWWPGCARAAGPDPADREGGGAAALATPGRAGVPGADPAQWWACATSPTTARAAPPASPCRSRPPRSRTSAAAAAVGAAGRRVATGRRWGHRTSATWCTRSPHDLGDTDAATLRRGARGPLGPARAGAGWLADATSAGPRRWRPAGRATSPRPRGRGLAPGRRRASGSGWPWAGRRHAAGSTGSSRRPTAGCAWSTSRPARASRRWTRCAGTAARCLPARGGGGRVRGAGERSRAGRRCCSSAGQPAKTTTLQLQPPLDPTTSRLGPRPGRARWPRAWPARCSRPRRAPVRHLPGQGLLPRLRGGGRLYGRRHGIRAGASRSRGTVRWGAVELRRALGRRRAHPRAGGRHRGAAARRCSSWPGPGRARPRPWPPG